MIDAQSGYSLLKGPAGVMGRGKAWALKEISPALTMVNISRLHLTHEACLAWVMGGVGYLEAEASVRLWREHPVVLSSPRRDERHLTYPDVKLRNFRVLGFEPNLLTEGEASLENLTFLVGGEKKVSIQNLLEIRRKLISS